MPYIYSTLSTDMDYASYVPTASDVPDVEKIIKIKGGANVANKNIITPMGVMTSVTDEELALLEANGVFQIHKANGFITVEKKSDDVEKVTKNMTKKDKSAPLTPADYENTETNVIVNKD